MAVSLDWFSAGTRSTTTTAAGSFGSNTPVAGHLLIAVVTGTGSSAVTFSTAQASGTTGWTQLRADVGSSTTAGDSRVGVGVWYKYAAGGDAAPSFTVGVGSGPTSQCDCYSLSGSLTSGNPLDTSGTESSSGAGTGSATVTSTAVTTAAAPAGAGEFAILAAARYRGTTTAPTITATTGYTLDSNDGATTSTGHRGVAHEASVATGSAVTATITYSSTGTTAYGAGVLVLIQAAPSNPPPTITPRSGSGSSASSGTGGGGNVSSQALTLSSSIGEGDLVVVAVSCSGAGTASAVTLGLSDASGVEWKRGGLPAFGGGSAFGTTATVAVFTGIANASTPGAIATATTSTSGEMVVAACSYIGAIGVDFYASGDITAGGTTMTEPSGTTSGPADMLVGILGLWTASTATLTPTAPTDCSTVREAGPTGDFQYLGIADSGTSTGPAVGSVGGGSWSWTGSAAGGVILMGLLPRVTQSVSKAATATSGSTATVTPPYNLTQSTKLVIGIGWASSTTQTVSSVKDAAGNSFTKVTSAPNSGGPSGTDLWFLDTPQADVGTAPVITVTFSGTVNASLLLQEVRGLVPGTSTAAVMDGTAATHTGAGGSSATSGVYSSAVAGEFLVGVYGDDGGPETLGTPTGSTTLTKDANCVSANSFADVGIAWGSSIGGSESVSWPLSGTSADWGTIIAAFQVSPVYQIYTGGPAVGSSISIPVSTAPGDVIVASVNANGSASGVTDSQGNTYVLAASDSGDDTYVWVATYNGSSGTPTKALVAGTDTVTISGALVGGGVMIIGVTGRNPVAMDFASFTHNASTTSPSGPSTGTLPQAGDVVIYAMLGAWSPGPTVTFAAGFEQVSAAPVSGGSSVAGWGPANGTSSVTPSATFSTAELIDAFTIALAPLSTSTPVSSSDASGTTVDAGENVVVLGSDTSSGAETQQVGVSSADSSSGAETQVIHVSDTDSCTGTDAGAVNTWLVHDTDTSTGADALAQLTVQGSDTSAGTDALKQLTVQGADTSGPATDAGETIHVSDTDSCTGTDAGQVGVFSADTSSGAGAGETIHLPSSADTSSGAETQQVGVSSADTSGPATDAGAVNTVLVSSSDTSTGTEQGTVHVSDTDTSSGTDAGSVTGQGVSDSDTSTGTDAVTRLAVLGADTSSGAETQTIHVSDTDTSTGTDAGSVGGESVSDSDTSTGTDALTQLKVLGADTSSGAEGAQTVHVSDSDTSTGTDAASVHVSDTDASSGTDALGRLVVQGADSSAGADALAQLTVLGADTSSGTDSGSITGESVSGADTSTGTDAGETIHVSDSDTSTVAEAGSAGGNQVVTDADYCHVVDSGFSYISDGDTCTGTDGGEGFAVRDADTSQMLEVELSKWPSDSDVCKVDDEGWWSGPLSDSDTASGSEGHQVIYLSDSDSCTMAETYIIDVYTYVPPWDIGPGGGLLRVVHKGRVLWEGPQVTGEALRLQRWLAAHPETEVVVDHDGCRGSDDEAPVVSVTVSLAPALRVTATLRALPPKGGRG